MSMWRSRAIWREGDKQSDDTLSRNQMQVGSSYLGSYNRLIHRHIYISLVRYQVFGSNLYRIRDEMAWRVAST